MIRWIVIFLIVALPLRSGMAAAQICPWMAASSTTQTVSAPFTPMTQASLDDACAGMSAVDGKCTLQAGCAATPLLFTQVHVATLSIPPLHVPWYAVHSLFTYAPVPQRIPIAHF